jgi:SnoaL-like polyketide cyclase
MTGLVKSNIVTYLDLARREASMNTKVEYSIDRVSSVRRMIEEGGDKSTELFSPNFVSHTPWHLAEKRNARASGSKGSFAAHLFSDLRIRVEEAIEQGDKVVVRWRLWGKWTQAFAGLKPTNKPVEVTGINIYRFVGDKIVEETGQFDLGSLSQQMISGGVNPAACKEAFEALSRPPEMISPA